MKANRRFPSWTSIVMSWKLRVSCEGRYLGKLGGRQVLYSFHQSIIDTSLICLVKEIPFSNRKLLCLLHIEFGIFNIPNYYLQELVICRNPKIIHIKSMLIYVLSYTNTLNSLFIQKNFHDSSLIYFAVCPTKLNDIIKKIRVPTSVYIFVSKKDIMET